ncbi:hypothetical protein [uncultured Granulicatella sp.]|uniref:hypothetical protein n=1 Tax=uncultured Granulicatella sp. TaxID=316089 RepID=UPI0028D33E76|nr:hypothetical protein [uncultured Granulicatella sp.]
MCFTMIALGVILSFLFVVLFVFLFNFAYIVFDISEWIGDTIADVVEWIFDTFERMWQR